MELLPRVHELVPRKYTTFVLLFFAGLLAIAALEGLYWWMPQVAGLTTDGSVESLDLDGEGSLAVWFSSFLLTMAGFTSLVVFAVRRRKVDDYHARYRVWFWASLCWFLLSIDETASLHEAFKELMSYVSGTRLFGDGSAWWIIAYGVLLSNVGCFLWIDMRGCWSSRLTLVATGLSFAAAVVAQMQIVPGLSVAHGVMIEEGCEMLGDLFLLLSMGLHARYAIQHAGTLLPTKSSRRAKRAAAVADASAAADTNAPPPVRVKAKSSGEAKTKVAAEAPAKAKTVETAKPKSESDLPKSKPAETASKPKAESTGFFSAVAASPKPAAPPAPPAKSVSPPSAPPVKPASISPTPVPSTTHLRIDPAEHGERDGTHQKLSRAERKALKRERRSRDDSDED